MDLIEKYKVKAEYYYSLKYSEWKLGLITRMQETENECLKLLKTLPRYIEAPVYEKLIYEQKLSLKSTTESLISRAWNNLYDSCQVLIPNFFEQLSDFNFTESSLEDLFLNKYCVLVDLILEKFISLEEIVTFRDVESVEAFCFDI